MNTKAMLWIFNSTSPVSKIGPNRILSEFGFLDMLPFSQIGKVNGTVLGYVGDEYVINPNNGHRVVGEVG